MHAVCTIHQLVFYATIPHSALMLPARCWYGVPALCLRRRAAIVPPSQATRGEGGGLLQIHSGWVIRVHITAREGSEDYIVRVQNPKTTTCAAKLAMQQNPKDNLRPQHAECITDLLRHICNLRMSHDVVHLRHNLRYGLRLWCCCCAWRR